MLIALLSLVELIMKKVVNSQISFIIKFPYNAHSDWLKQRALSENGLMTVSLPRNFEPN